MKELVRKSGRSISIDDSSLPCKGKDVQDYIRKLRLQIQQRDNEINVLVSILKKKEDNRYVMWKVTDTLLTQLTPIVAGIEDMVDGVIMRG